MYLVAVLSSCGKTLHFYLNMSTQHWTKVISQRKPPARYFHTTCCIAGPLTGQEHSLLMIVGGDGQYEVLGDVWLLDVDKGEWSEVGMLYLIV